jgi:hypothetical protein
MNFEQLRSVRNKFLCKTDMYVMISDFPLSNEQREELVIYRQLLRELPTYITNNDIICDDMELKTVFPIPPEWLKKYINFD